MLTATQRRLALAGVVGPVAFMVAWIVGGLVVRGYSSVHFSVSRLAAVGVSYRWMMVTALVVLGVGLLLYAPSLRSALPGLAWITATATGVSSLALVAYPLHARATPMHNVWAAAAYLGIASTPIFAYRPFAEAGMMSAARLSAGAGVIAGACLELTVIAPWAGLFQRIGFTTSLAWISVTAVILFRDGTLLERGASPVEAPRRPDRVSSPS